MKKPAWLRWQPLVFSPWLSGLILVVGAPIVFGPLVLAWYRTRGLTGKEFFAELWGLERFLQQPPPILLVVTAVFTALLVWFTYFSGSKRVSDSDKFAVLLMLCGAAIGWIRLLLQVF